MFTVNKVHILLFLAFLLLTCCIISSIISIWKTFGSKEGINEKEDRETFLGLSVKAYTIMAVISLTVACIVLVVAYIVSSKAEIKDKAGIKSISQDTGTSDSLTPAVAYGNDRKPSKYNTNSDNGSDEVFLSKENNMAPADSEFYKVLKRTKKKKNVEYIENANNNRNSNTTND